jgi:hypothetical protein
LLIVLTLAHPRAWRCNFVALVFPLSDVSATCLATETGLPNRAHRPGHAVSRLRVAYAWFAGAGLEPVAMAASGKAFLGRRGHCRRLLVDVLTGLHVDIRTRKSAASHFL